MSLPLAVLRSKLRPGPRQDAHLPTVEIVERLHEVLSASSPARQLRDEDGVDLTCLSEGHDLLAPNAVVSGTRGGFLEDAVILGRRIGHRPSDKKAKKVLAMHLDGLSYRLIGGNVGLSKNTVVEIVRRGAKV